MPSTLSLPRTWSVAFAALLVACSSREKICRTDEQCVAENGGLGFCVLSHCAFLDPSCPGSALRWDRTAGDWAEMCVPAELAGDGGPVDAPTPTDGPTDGPMDGPSDARLVSDGTPSAE